LFNKRPEDLSAK